MASTMEMSKTQLLKLKAYVKLMRAANAVTRRLHQYLVDYGLTISQFGILEALYNLGPMHQKALGQKILKTGGNITLVIDNLVKRDLVTRTQDVKDRRYTKVRLTSGGRELFEEVFPIHVARAEEVFAALTLEEIETLGNLLKTLGTAAV